MMRGLDFHTLVAACTSMSLKSFPRWWQRATFAAVITTSFLLPSAGHSRVMEVTAYCSCGKCNSYSRGHWLFLKLDFWNRTVNAGPDRGRKYTGKTASGASLCAVNPGLLSGDSLRHPTHLAGRILLPWRIFPSDGTIAADTAYYPFGTRMYVPGYGWGTVQDRGGDIKGPDRLDVFFPRHSQTLQWGRQQVDVTIQ